MSATEITFPSEQVRLRKQVLPPQSEITDVHLGRRVCPGYHLAENSLFILASRLLWAFDVQAPRNAETGRPVDIDVWDYPPTSLFGPNPFKAEFRLRSERKGNVIREKLSMFEKREIEKI